MKSPWRPRAKRLLLAVAILAACIAPAAGAGLGLRVHDAIGEPGGPIAVVLRTYASRPIGQGQLCLQVSSDPWAAFDGFEVFASMPDVQSEATPDLDGGAPQTVLLEFASPSASINETDGPLAVLFLRLGEDLQSGQTYTVWLDMQNTFLMDGDGEPIPIDPRAGELRIRAPGDPIHVAAHAEDTPPGGIARLGMETYEPIPLSGGRVGIRYDTGVAGGTPTVRMDPRHGQASFTADTSEPGLVLVEFDSPDGSLNEVPGTLIDVSLPTSQAVPPGTESPVFLDPDLTLLNDVSGQPLALLLEGDVLEFAGALPGAVSGLELARSAGGDLLLTWNGDCGGASRYAIYRGDLAFGYGSLAPEPGRCDVGGAVSIIPAGTGEADFFIVVPHDDDFEGSFGVASDGFPRPAAAAVCHPQGPVHECAP